MYVCMCESYTLFPVNNTLVMCRILGPHNTLFCVLISDKMEVNLMVDQSSLNGTISGE